MFLSHLQLGSVIHCLSELRVIFQSSACFCFGNRMKLILAALCFFLHNIGKNTVEVLSVSSAWPVSRCTGLICLIATALSFG